MLHRYLILLLLASPALRAQYAPPAGQHGSTAIDKDHAAITGWAVSCSLRRGYQDISNPQLGRASAGDSTMACGKAMDNGAVSLGDGGSATCTFSYPIRDGLGPDFAVFENSFSDSYLELAFVEVSSNGIDFTRFPAHCLTQQTVQVGPFDTTDTRKLDNFAGKYRGGFGTPFDLAWLTGTPGLDRDRITHVRVVDVVGSINPLYGTKDSQGNWVNDPWPTAFASSGFDLDAIAVLNSAPAALKETGGSPLGLFPNPASRGQDIRLSGGVDASYSVEDLSGRAILQGTGESIRAGALPAGFFVVRTGSGVARLIVY